MCIIRTKAFSLIELIIVTAIIGILTSVIVPSAMNAMEKAKIARLMGDFNAIKRGIFSYYADTGKWGKRIWTPGGFDEGLEGWCNSWSESSFMQDDGSASWDGPYLSNTPTPNPWGHNYNYIVISQTNFFGLAESDARFLLTSFDQSPNTTKKIDAMLDDGNILTGEFRTNEHLSTMLPRAGLAPPVIYLISRDGPVN